MQINKNLNYYFYYYYYWHFLYMNLFRILKLFLSSKASQNLKMPSLIIFSLYSVPEANWCHYSYLSNKLDLILRSMKFHNLRDVWLSGGYANWFRSYLSNRKSRALVSGLLSSRSEVLSGGPGAFHNNWRDAVTHYELPLLLTISEST
jgi:hypothetical protein